MKRTVMSVVVGLACACQAFSADAVVKPGEIGKLDTKTIDAVEVLIKAVAPDEPIKVGFRATERAMHDYRQALDSQDTDRRNRQMAKLKRTSPSAYERVLKVLSADERAKAVAYVSELGNKPIPPAPEMVALSKVSKQP